MSQSNDGLKQASLTALGYICEEINPDNITEYVNTILTAVVQGGVPEVTNIDVKTAAIKALLASLEFVRANFNIEQERNFIIESDLEATRVPSVTLKTLAFECLVKVADLYYDKLPAYMQAIFTVTINAIQNEVKDVALQAIEFWTTLAEVEMGLQFDEEEAIQNNTKPQHTSAKYVIGALKHLVAALLTTLVKQEEDQEEGEWNVSMAGATSLALIADCAGDQILNEIMPFITENIASPDWRKREAATMSLGSILEGPEKLVEIVRGATPVLLRNLHDKNELVKDTTTWTLGRICLLHLDSILHQLDEVMNGLTIALKDTPRIASVACWAIKNVVDSLNAQSSNAANSAINAEKSKKLVGYFQPVMKQLLDTCARPDSDESGLRQAAITAMTSTIFDAPEEVLGLVAQLLPLYATELGNLLKSADPKKEMAGPLCLMIQTCISRLGADVRKAIQIDQLMELLVNSLKAPSALADAMPAIGALADIIEGDMTPYFPHFLPFFLDALRKHAEYETCGIAVGTIGDICRSIGTGCASAAPEIVRLLLEALKAPTLDRSVKPPILSAFGDLAMAIGQGFIPYMEVVSTTLLQAQNMALQPTDDEDMIDYLNLLRQGICEAYSGILQGIQSLPHLVPLANQIMTFVVKCYEDQNKTEEVVHGIVGVLGDVAHVMGAHAKQMLVSPQVATMISQIIQSTQYEQRTLNIALWAKDMISKL